MNEMWDEIDFFCMHINIEDFDGSNYVLLIQNAKSGSDLFYW